MRLCAYRKEGDNVEVYELYDLFGNDIENGDISDVCREEICKYLMSVMRSDVKGVRMLLSRLYRYLLKYKYQPENQALLWIEIVRMASIDLTISLEEKYMRDRIGVEVQQDIYADIVKGLSVEMNVSKKIFPSKLPAELSLENLMDYSAVHRYLRKYAHCKHVKEELNI